MKARSDGRGDPVRLSRQASLYFTPAWAADGRIVAFRGDVEAYESQGAAGENGREIVWLPSDPTDDSGSSATLIAPTDGRSGAHFVAGSNRIYDFVARMLSCRSAGTAPTKRST